MDSIRPFEERALGGSDGATIAAALWPGSGEPLVCVHGLSSSSRAFCGLATELPGRQVLAVDCRGRGQSSKEGSFGLARHAADLAAAMDSAGIGRAVIVGHSMGAFVALAFTLLGASMALIQSQRRVASRFADILLILLCFLALVLVSGDLFRFVEVPRPLLGNTTAPETLFCIAILCLIAVLRHARSSVYAVFLGRGIAGRIARFAAPILLCLPFLREGTRILFMGTSRIPPSFFSAILASLASLLSLGLLLYIARRISTMESEMLALSLRDELTGLLNLRGFRLLAEQALRMARRSHVPFSLLFIDLDKLKEINDSFGHTIGSNILADTGEILMATFRESDVLGRVGGDEFAVAGQFSQAAITVAVHRLREAIAQRNARHAQEPLLSLSLGHVTCEPDGAETLDELLEKADFSMYEEKRLKQSRTA